MQPSSNPKITISGFDIEWDLSQGINLWAGTPTLSMWIPNTTAGMMAGFCRMVGEERFNLCMQIGGINSIEGDWAIISSAPTFEEGLARISEIAWPAGWGRWNVESLDRVKKEARYRTHNSWEGLYQRALNVCWGSGMMAGKLDDLADGEMGEGVPSLRIAVAVVRECAGLTARPAGPPLRLTRRNWGAGGVRRIRGAGLQSCQAGPACYRGHTAGAAACTSR